MLISRIALVAAAGLFLAFGEITQELLANERGPDRSEVSELREVAKVSGRAALVLAIDEAVARLDPHIVHRSHPESLRYAVRAYLTFASAHPEEVVRPYLYFVDYGLDSRTPRGYLLDMQALRVVDGPFHVAHGRGSVVAGGDVPTRFLDVVDSNSTSLGLYVAEETYGFRGKSGGRPYQSLGLRLRGVSGRFNSAARARGIVVHGAPYVTSGGAGRSEGCPAVEPGRAGDLISRIANGGLVFHFSPLDARWMREDPWAGVIQPSIAGLY